MDVYLKWLISWKHSLTLGFSPLTAAKLPYSIRILLESALRNCDNFQVCTLASASKRMCFFVKGCVHAGQHLFETVEPFWLQ